MKKDSQLMLLFLSWRKKIYMIILIISWFVLTPFLYNMGMDLIKYNMDLNVYLKYLSQIQCVLLLCFLFCVGKDFVDDEIMEVTMTIHHNKRIKYYLYSFIIFQILMMPIYYISYSIYRMFPFQFVVVQQLFIVSMFYMLSFVLVNSFMSLGICLTYMLLMTSMLYYFPSLFHYDSYLMNSTHFTIKYICIMLIYFGLGLRKETKNLS